MKYQVIITKKKVKYLRLKVKDGIVYVSSPFGVNKQTIDNFVLSNTEFIEKAIGRQQIQKEKETINYEDEIIILGKKYQVLPTSLNSKVTQHYIFINKELDIKKEIKRLFKDELFIKMKQLTKYYFDKMALNCPMPSIIIKDVKSKWGSYWKNKHLIEYSSNLLFKNDITYDYLVIHELAHIIEFNHSSKFYDIVSKYCPNYKQLRKQLKGR